jgi:CRISPR-associated protein Csx1
MFNTVKFTAYNADPYVPNISDRLSINVVEEGFISPRPFRSIPADRKLLRARDLDSGEREKLSRRMEGFLRDLHEKEISAFIGGIYNGLPLALYAFHPDTDKLEESIRQTLEAYKEYASVRWDNGIKVIRRVEFTESFRGYLFSYLMARLLEKNDIINERRNEVCLDDIEYVNERLFSYDTRLKTRIGSELHNLKDRERELGGEWKLYKEILGERIGEPDSRNFLAHAGFERNLIELRKDPHRGILLRYREDKIRTVKTFCREGLNMVLGRDRPCQIL